MWSAYLINWTFRYENVNLSGTYLRNFNLKNIPWIIFEGKSPKEDKIEKKKKKGLLEKGKRRYFYHYF